MGPLQKINQQHLTDEKTEGVSQISTATNGEDNHMGCYMTILENCKQNQLNGI